MKIRHKQSGVELEGVRDSGPDFVEGASVIQPSSIYSKEHWEAVPEWVNVSGDVEVSADGEAIMGDGRVLSRCPVGYRFRKVVPGLDKIGLHAFIVERKA